MSYFAVDTIERPVQRSNSSKENKKQHILRQRQTKKQTKKQTNKQKKKKTTKKTKQKQKQKQKRKHSTHITNKQQKLPTKKIVEVYLYFISNIRVHAYASAYTFLPLLSGGLINTNTIHPKNEDKQLSSS